MTLLRGPTPLGLVLTSTGSSPPDCGRPIPTSTLYSHSATEGWRNSPMSPSDLPPLDCHAHIAPDVTKSQIGALKGAIIFAMTRSPAEAGAAARRSDATILWAFGAHPGVPAAVAAVTE